ncbi:hypothetical protein PEPS_46470 (plasmid) [Persicobacter psychrovividus]|uniref:Uncharacterized protein n=1 Tax=Persicobacter psychrovividus TaxID=387638 RepID=A0ABN6LLP7_9BACT|nr:hypothetical protein PEPS_46470 [Persicobacter psychrovividus]
MELILCRFCLIAQNGLKILGVICPLVALVKQIEQVYRLKAGTNILLKFNNLLILLGTFFSCKWIYATGIIKRFHDSSKAYFWFSTKPSDIS